MRIDSHQLMMIKIMRNNVQRNEVELIPYDTFENN